MTAIARVAVLSRYIVNLYSALTVQLAAEQDNRVVKKSVSRLQPNFLHHTQQ